jgi:hypothetical protein
MKTRAKVQSRTLLTRVFLACLLAGAVVVVPLAGTLFGGAPTAEAVTTYTRSASCAGLDFYPTDSDTAYANLGTARYRTDASGTGVFRCDPGLPTGAKVKKIQFTIDSFATYQCLYRRSGLTAAGAETYETIGQVSVVSTGGVPTRLSTTAITNGTINNASYGYWLECSLPANDQGRLYGADVIYSISAANG